MTTARTLEVPGGHDGTARFRRALGLGEDLLVMVGVVLLLPLVILAIGIPIAAFVQFVLWMVRSL